MNNETFPKSGWYYQQKDTKSLVTVKLVVSEPTCEVVTCPLSVQKTGSLMDYKECTRMSLEEFHQKYRLYNP